MKIRKPPSPLSSPHFAVLTQGTVLHRIHRTTCRAAQFNPGLGGPARFAPFNDDTGAPVPSLYASDSLRAAIHETIFHDIPPRARIKTVRLNDVRIRTHSELLANRDLRLVELRNVPLNNWGISRTELISASPNLCDQTVFWAAAIHRDMCDAEGLVWTSNQCDPDDACLFFGDRVHESDFTAIRSRNGVSDESLVNDVRVEGRRRGIALTI